MDSLASGPREVDRPGPDIGIGVVVGDLRPGEPMFVIKLGAAGQGVQSGVTSSRVVGEAQEPEEVDQAGAGRGNWPDPR